MELYTHDNVIIPNDMVSPLYTACEEIECEYLPKLKELIERIVPMITRFEPDNKSFYYHKMNALYMQRVVECIDNFCYFIKMYQWEDLEIYVRVLWEIVLQCFFLNFNCNKTTDVPEEARMKGELSIIYSELSRRSKLGCNCEDRISQQKNLLKKRRDEIFDKLNLPKGGNHWYGYKINKLVEIVIDKLCEESDEQNTEEQESENMDNLMATKIIKREYSMISLTTHVDHVRDYQAEGVDLACFNSYLWARRLPSLIILLAERITKIYRKNLLGEFNRLFLKHNTRVEFYETSVDRVANYIEEHYI